MLFDEEKLSPQKFDNFLLLVLELPIFCRVFFTEKQKGLKKEELIELWKEKYSNKRPKEILFDLLADSTEKDFL